MAFVNEYVSKEDIEKFELDKLVEKYKFYPDSQQLGDIDWTYDEGRDSWLISCGEEHHSVIDHAGTNEKIFILHYKRVDIEARVWLEEDSKTNIYESPFIVIWKFLSITPSSFNSTDEDEIKAVLKEFLTHYGSRGIRAQEEAKNAIVQFREF